jgi:hypothetical protein
MSPQNFVCHPAGANPARPGVSPPEPVVSLATVSMLRALLCVGLLGVAGILAKTQVARKRIM